MNFLLRAIVARPAGIPPPGQSRRERLLKRGAPGRDRVPTRGAAATADEPPRPPAAPIGQAAGMGRLTMGLSPKAATDSRLN